MKLKKIASLALAGVMAVSMLAGCALPLVLLLLSRLSMISRRLLSLLLTLLCRAHWSRLLSRLAPPIALAVAVVR